MSVSSPAKRREAKWNSARIVPEKRKLYGPFGRIREKTASVITLVKEARMVLREILTWKWCFTEMSIAIVTATDTSVVESAAPMSDHFGIKRKFSAIIPMNPKKASRIGTFTSPAPLRAKERT